MDTTGACFHAKGKYCLQRTALNTFVTKVIVRLGGCLRTVFGILFGPEALPTLSPLISRRTSEELVFSVHLLGHTSIQTSPR
jgi:hypothetical protein